MATGGQVSKIVGAGRLFTTTDSIQIAVRGVTGTTYTDLDSMATNCLPVLLDETGTSTGTRNSTPTQITDFRGYPKPEITMNYETVPVDNISGNKTITKEYLAADLPSLNHSVGFQTVFTASVVERRNNSGGTLLSSHSKTFTYNGGSGTTNKTPDSSTATEIGGSGSGLYQLSYSAPTSSYDVWVQVTITADTGFYITSTTYTATMTYSEVINYYEHQIDTFSSGNNCSGTASGSPVTRYSDDQVLAVGSKVYTNTALTTHISQGTYINVNGEGDPFDFFYYYANAISAYTICGE